jgi:GT2 family glycosyltransferase
MNPEITNAFIEELTHQAAYEFGEVRDPIDIIIVVHNQRDYIKKCVETLYENTENFKLYIWDNGSDEPTAGYLKQIATEKSNIYLERCEENLGFIRPNNILAAKGSSPYLVLLNSDTEVYKGWDTAMVGWLKAKTEYAQVGYLGGMLEENGQGGKSWSGECIDYVCGWCVCMPRTIFNKVGLFDEDHLKFAYGEDADLSLRLIEAGYKLRALHLGLVLHHGNATINEVKLKQDCKTTFIQNHDYIRLRWGSYLLKDRALLRPQTYQETL